MVVTQTNVCVHMGKVNTSNSYATKKMQKFSLFSSMLQKNKKTYKNMKKVFDLIVLLK